MSDQPGAKARAGLFGLMRGLKPPPPSAPRAGNPDQFCLKAARLLPRAEGLAPRRRAARLLPRAGDGHLYI